MYKIGYKEFMNEPVVRENWMSSSWRKASFNSASPSSPKMSFDMSSSMNVGLLQSMKLEK